MSLETDIEGDDFPSPTISKGNQSAIKDKKNKFDLKTLVNQPNNTLKHIFSHIKRIKQLENHSMLGDYNRKDHDEKDLFLLEQQFDDYYDLKESNGPSSLLNSIHVFFDWWKKRNVSILDFNEISLFLLTDSLIWYGGSGCDYNDNGHNDNNYAYFITNLAIMHNKCKIGHDAYALCIIELQDILADNSWCLLVKMLLRVLRLIDGEICREVCIILLEKYTIEDDFDVVCCCKRLYEKGDCKKLLVMSLLVYHATSRKSPNTRILQQLYQFQHDLPVNSKESTTMVKDLFLKLVNETVHVASALKKEPIVFHPNLINYHYRTQ